MGKCEIKIPYKVKRLLKEGFTYPSGDYVKGDSLALFYRNKKWELLIYYEYTVIHQSLKNVLDKCTIGKRKVGD